jgi:hypothetical protein
VCVHRIIPFWAERAMVNLKVVVREEGERRGSANLTQMCMVAHSCHAYLNTAWVLCQA